MALTMLNTDAAIYGVYLVCVWTDLHSQLSSSSLTTCLLSPQDIL